MRARRKRKEQFEKKQKDHDDVDDATTATTGDAINNDESVIDDNHDENAFKIGGPLKRKRAENDELQTASTTNNSTTTTNISDKSTNTTITIASHIPTKEAKKIRKNARRKARKRGKDESTISFVNEHNQPIFTTTADDDDDDDDDDNNDDTEQSSSQTPPPPPPKRKKVFPNINQILIQAAKNKATLLIQQKSQSYQDSIPLEIKQQYVALDCEMVGIGPNGTQSALARVSIVDWFGLILLDTFVQVPDRVTDFRTHVSGVRPKDILPTNSKSMELHACRKTVGECLKNKILVGHSLSNDFKALMLHHPKQYIRDTAKYKPLMRKSGKHGGKLRPRKLKDLVYERVNMVIQKDGEAHTSVEDARATMELYKCVRESWEKEIEKMEFSKTKKKNS